MTCPIYVVTLLSGAKTTNDQRQTMSTQQLTMGPLTDLTAFQRDLLRTILSLDSEEKAHGLSIKSELEAQYEDELNHGRLYPNLDELVDSGLVEKHEWDLRTNVYRATSRGRREFRSHVQWTAEVLGSGDDESCENDGKKLVTDGGHVVDTDKRTPEFDEPRDGTERANILLEELGGLPEDNPFADVVRDLREQGESWQDIYETMYPTEGIVDKAAAEERNTLVPDWKVAAVVHDEHATSGGRYEYFERGAETADEAEQMVRDMGHRVDESKTEQIGVSKVF